MQHCLISEGLREGQPDACRQSLQHVQTASAASMQPESGQNKLLANCSASISNIVLLVLSRSLTTHQMTSETCSHSSTGRPEHLSAHWAYPAAKNRSAGALSPTERASNNENNINVPSPISHEWREQKPPFSPDSGLLVLVNCSVSGHLLHPPVSLQQRRTSGPAAPLL